jgi:hypothetical protein
MSLCSRHVTLIKIKYKHILYNYASIRQSPVYVMVAYRMLYKLYELLDLGSCMAECVFADRDFTHSDDRYK